jgi:hypothetical protein
MTRCRAEVWPNAPKNPKAERGVCIYHLALLTAANRGEKDAAAFFRSIGAQYPDEGLKHITAIAKETLARRQT